MSTCLFCHAFLEELNSWTNLFSLSSPDPVCKTCLDKLEKIEGELCMICGRPFTALSQEYREGDICFDCVRWQQDERWCNALTKNRSLYLYNDFGKEIISLYKFRGDHILSQAFRTAFNQAYSTNFTPSYLIIPIPLSPERLYERGFNQATELAKLLDKPIYEILTRTHLEKQSKKRRNERIQSENVFHVVEKDTVRGKDVLLIDDIYTTGSTLRHAAEVLRKVGVKSVSSLTLMRG